MTVDLPGASPEGANSSASPAEYRANLPGRGGSQASRPGSFSRIDGSLSLKKPARKSRVIELLYIVAGEHGVSTEDILGQRRHKRIIAARHEVIRRAYLETGLSTTQIGRLLNRDHTTVLYVCGLTKKNRASARPDIFNETKPRVVKSKPSPAKEMTRPKPGVDLADLGPDQCRYPLGGPKERAREFCGEPVADGKPYCLEHAKLCYLKPSHEKGEPFHLGKFIDRPRMT